jgi:hypothetical protein
VGFSVNDEIRRKRGLPINFMRRIAISNKRIDAVPLTSFADRLLAT